MPPNLSLIVLTLSLACASLATTKAGIVINEIYYHAPNRFEDLEWIELHNTDSARVNLSNWKIQNGVEYTFPTGSQIAGSGYLVLCRDTKLFHEFYRAEVSGEFEGKLNNGGETIDLVNDKGLVVDTVTYDDKSPWPTAPDGHSPSLERIVATASGNDALNWAPSILPASAENPTGSPGQKNDASGDHPRISVDLQVLGVEPGQPIRVTALPDTSKQSLRSVELGYQVVTPGSISQEAWMPMTSEKEYYTAKIPSQDPGTLIRYRVALKTNNGSTVHFPHPNELRPTHSAYVSSAEKSTQLPQFHIINTRTEDTHTLGRQLSSVLRASRGGSSFSRESMMARFQVNNALSEIARAWLTLAIQPDAQFSDKTLSAIQVAFAQADEAKRKLLRELDTDSTLAGKGIQDIQEQLRVALTEQLPPEQLNTLFTSPSGQGRRGPGQAFADVLPLENDWMSITIDIKPQGQRYTELRDAFRDAFNKRENTGKNFRPTRNFRQDMAKLVKPIRDELNKVLNARILHLLENARRSQGSPIRPNFDGIERRPPRGESALIVHQGTKTRVYDYVNISTRSAGFKVRLHDDRPYNGIKTLNIIFEYNDRFVLAEPLAFDLYRRAGSPACLTEFVSLKVNGKSAGYHLLFEHINGAFLRRNELSSNGDLYKILWWGRSIEDGHQRKGDWDGGHEELSKLIAALSQSEGEEQWQLIEKHFDVQQVATYFAVNTVLSHWDGFFNNHFSYRDPKRDKWMMFPWDQDKTWGFHDSLPEGTDFVDMPLTFGKEGDRPPRNFQGMRNSWWRPGGQFSRPLLANDQFRKIYLNETKRILDTIYNEENYFPVIDAMAAKLRQDVAIRANLIGEPPTEALRRLEANVASLKRHLTKRRAFLLSQDELKSL